MQVLCFNCRHISNFYSRSCIEESSLYSACISCKYGKVTHTISMGFTVNKSLLRRKYKELAVILIKANFATYQNRTMGPHWTKLIEVRRRSSAYPVGQINPASDVSGTVVCLRSVPGEVSCPAFQCYESTDVYRLYRCYPTTMGFFIHLTSLSRLIGSLQVYTR